MRRRSFKQRLIVAFLLTAGVPLLLMSSVSYSNSVVILGRNTDQMMALSLQKTKSNLDAWLSSYEELLYQICVNDDIVQWTDDLNHGVSRERAYGQLKSELQSLFYTRSYIKSITLLPAEGQAVFYDQFTTAASQNSWIANMGLSEKELYDEISSDGKVHFYSTRYATTFGGERQYMFHFGRRLVDYMAVNKKSAVVILSVDAALLNKLCAGTDENSSGLEFILDGSGRVLSFPDFEQIGSQVLPAEPGREENKRACLDFVNQWNASDRYTAAYIEHDDRYGWDIVGVSDQSGAIAQLRTQQERFVSLILLSLAMTILFSLLQTKVLGRSMRTVLDAFESVGRGDLTTRLNTKGGFFLEMVPILDKFNGMLERLERSANREKEANAKSRAAEIAALEAQINPHFLYNTLDTINWMAISRDENEISDAISALGQILRYGVVESDRMVPVEDEIRWLDKYLLLQQIRLKNTFRCEIDVDEKARRALIHKLVLQPFVENAILHGFPGVKHDCLLSVGIMAEGDSLLIHIRDNGRGIPLEIAECVNRDDFQALEARNHIGMRNAVSRIRIYYGDRATVRIEIGQGTTVHIRIPMQTME